MSSQIESISAEAREALNTARPLLEDILSPISFSASTLNGPRLSHCSNLLLERAAEIDWRAVHRDDREQVVSAINKLIPALQLLERLDENETKLPGDEAWIRSCIEQTLTRTRALTQTLRTLPLAHQSAETPEATIDDFNKHLDRIETQEAADIKIREETAHALKKFEKLNREIEPKFDFVAKKASVLDQISVLLGGAFNLLKEKLANAGSLIRTKLTLLPSPSARLQVGQSAGSKTILTGSIKSPSGNVANVGLWTQSAYVVTAQHELIRLDIFLDSLPSNVNSELREGFFRKLAIWGVTTRDREQFITATLPVRNSGRTQLPLPVGFVPHSITFLDRHDKDLSAGFAHPVTAGIFGGFLADLPSGTRSVVYTIKPSSLSVSPEFCSLVNAVWPKPTTKSTEFNVYVRQILRDSKLTDRQLVQALRGHLLLDNPCYSCDPFILRLCESAKPFQDEFMQGLKFGDCGQHAKRFVVEAAQWGIPGLILGGLATDCGVGEQFVVEPGHATALALSADGLTQIDLTEDIPHPGALPEFVGDLMAIRLSKQLTWKERSEIKANCDRRCNSAAEARSRGEAVNAILHGTIARKASRVSSSLDSSAFIDFAFAARRIARHLTYCNQPAQSDLEPETAALNDASYISAEPSLELSDKMKSFFDPNFQLLIETSIGEQFVDLWSLRMLNGPAELRDKFIDFVISQSVSASHNSITVRRSSFSERVMNGPRLPIRFLERMPLPVEDSSYELEAKLIEATLERILYDALNSLPQERKLKEDVVVRLLQSVDKRLTWMHDNPAVIQSLTGNICGWLSRISEHFAGGFRDSGKALPISNSCARIVAHLAEFAPHLVLANLAYSEAGVQLIELAAVDVSPRAALADAYNTVLLGMITPHALNDRQTKIPVDLFIAIGKAVGSYPIADDVKSSITDVLVDWMREQKPPECNYPSPDNPLSYLKLNFLWLNTQFQLCFALSEAGFADVDVVRANWPKVAESSVAKLIGTIPHLSTGAIHIRPRNQNLEVFDIPALAEKIVERDAVASRYYETLRKWQGKLLPVMRAFQDSEALVPGFLNKIIDAALQHDQGGPSRAALARVIVERQLIRKIAASERRAAVLWLGSVLTTKRGPPGDGLQRLVSLVDSQVLPAFDADDERASELVYSVLTEALGAKAPNEFDRLSGRSKLVTLLIWRLNVDSPVSSRFFSGKGLKHINLDILQDKSPAMAAWSRFTFLPPSSARGELETFLARSWKKSSQVHLGKYSPAGSDRRALSSVQLYGRGRTSDHTFERIGERTYAFGDDARSIDWNLFARTGQLYTAQYAPEIQWKRHLVIIDDNYLAGKVVTNLTKAQELPSLFVQARAAQAMSMPVEFYLSVSGAIRPLPIPDINSDANLEWYRWSEALDWAKNVRSYFGYLDNEPTPLDRISALAQLGQASRRDALLTVLTNAARIPYWKKEMRRFEKDLAAVSFLVVPARKF